MRNINPGDKITVQWGRWRLTAIVTKITRNGTVYAKRWNKSRKCWTGERRLYPWRGIFSTEELA